jgi:hypothetical protein
LFEYNIKNQGLFNFNFNFNTEVSGISVEFLETIASNDLTINQDIVSVSCACSDLPLFLNLKHGLSNANVLKQFLLRNSFNLDDNFAIRYKSKNNSWQSVKHFKGLGTEPIRIEGESGLLESFNERWFINFDLCCFQDVGDSYWRFLMFVKRVVDNNEDFETKILLDIPNDISCVNRNLNLNILYDPSNNDFYVNNVLLSSVLYYDEIGLFKNRFWNNNSFVVKIGPQVTYRKDPTINLRPIFTT